MVDCSSGWVWINTRLQTAYTFSASSTATSRGGVCIQLVCKFRKENTYFDGYKFKDRCCRSEYKDPEHFLKVNHSYPSRFQTGQTDTSENLG